jgi:hypothetical protein
MKIALIRFSRLVPCGAGNCACCCRHRFEALAQACEKSGSRAFQSTDEGKDQMLGKLSTSAKQLEAISTFLRHNPMLVEFLFDPEVAKLNDSPDRLLSAASGLASLELGMALFLAKDLTIAHLFS